MSALERITQGSHIIYMYYSVMFFIAYTLKGQVHVFAGRVKVLSHSSCRTSAILKYFYPLDVQDHLSLICLPMRSQGSHRLEKVFEFRG